MGMGVGGGGLLIVYLTLYLNLPQLSAQGTNLFLFASSGIASIFIYLKKGKIKLGRVALGAAFGAIGGFLSSQLLKDMDPEYAKVALGAFLIISGICTLYNAFIKSAIKKFKKTLYK